MSGGSWGYVYRTFEEAARDLKACTQPERVELGELVEKIARALHDIEWVDSYDYGEGDELAAIALCLGKGEK